MITLIWILVSIILITPIILWLISFKRSLSPLEGEIYVFAIAGLNLFEIRLGDPTAKWYQKLIYYIIFWPFKIVSFWYEWVQEMTYAEYLEKKEKSKTIPDYSVSVLWEPAYNKGGKSPDGTIRESDLGEDGIPKDKTVRILVSRKEKMISLKENEAFSLAVEFETKDGFRGWRLFTLMLKVEDLIKVITKFRQWQEAASKAFKGEYNPWSKTVTYEQLRSTRIDDLLLTIGSNTLEPFTDEINSTLTTLGFKIFKVMEGPIYLALETQDMLESQEQEKKAFDKKKTAIVEADTTQIKADAKAKALKTVENAKTEIIEERTIIAVTAAQDLSLLTVAQNTAKYGKNGVGALKGVYVEGAKTDNNTFDAGKLVENIISLKIVEEQKEGGES